MIKRYCLIVLIQLQLLFCVKLSFAQESIDMVPKSLFGIPGLTRELEGIYQQPLVTGTDLIYSISEDEYVVDSGDEFFIRVDVEGPDVKIINSVVSSDGFLTFDEAPFIHVRGKFLKEVKRIVYEHLKNYYKTDRIEISLKKIHYINISVIGALDPLELKSFTSANRLADVIQYLIVAYRKDTSNVYLLKNASIRKIRLIRGDQVKTYDILKYIRLKDNSQNPLLRSNDIIYIGFKNESVGNIYIKGAVGYPGKYEYVEGDNLYTIISLAGGLVPGADSSKIEIFRNEDYKQFHHVLSFDKNFLLKPGDYIYVHSKSSQKSKQFVTIHGEVNYPGIYPIIPGKTTLGEVLEWSGGFSPYADTRMAYIRRPGARAGWINEVNRIKNLKGSEPLYNIDKSILKVLYRQNPEIVQIDFSKLDSNSVGFLLKGGDVIYVPSKSLTVSLLGGVKYPGIYPYVEGFTVEDYIKIAGGFNNRALKGKIKIIEAKTNNWFDAELSSVPAANDKVFIPQKEEIDFWPLFKDILNVTVQVGTIIIIIRNVALK